MAHLLVTPQRLRPARSCPTGLAVAGGATVVAAVLVVACSDRTEPPRRAPEVRPAPVRAARARARPASSSAPAPDPQTSAARPTGAPGGGCLCPLPELTRRFAALTSCKFQRGLIDYQCGAWKAVGKALAKAEEEDRARVQATLLALLEHPDDRVRLSAARFLANYARQRSVERKLVARFGQESSGTVRAWLVFALGGRLPEARALLVRALRRDRDPQVRARAAQRAGGATFLADQAVRRALLEALQKDPVVVVRRRAAESLGQGSFSAEAERALLACLDHREVGPHCALGLARLGSRAGLEALTARLRAGLGRHHVEPLFALAAGQFDLRGAAAAGVLQLLGQVARDGRMNRPARQFALQAVGQIGRRIPELRRRAEQLLRAASGDKTIGRSARIALESMTKQARAAAGRPGRNPPPR